MIQPSALIHAHGQSRRVLPPYNSPFLTAAATPNFSKTCSRRTFNSIGAEESSNYHSPRVQGLMPPTLSWGPRKIDFCIFFRVLSYAKNHVNFGMPFFRFFRRFSRVPAVPTSIFMDFGSQNSYPEGRFLGLLSDRGCGLFFCVFFSKKRNNAKHEKVALSM